MPLDLEQMRLSGFEPDPNLKWEKINDQPPDGVDADSTFYPVVVDEHRVLAIYYAGAPGLESSVKEFNVHTKEWINEDWPSLTQPRSHFSCVMCNGKLYVIGGKLNGERIPVSSIECLDLSASPRQWEVMSEKLTSDKTAVECECVVIDKRICIFASSDCFELVSMEILDTETGQICTGPDMPPCHNVSVMDNELVAFSHGPNGILENGEMHFLTHGQPNAKWTTRPIKLPKAMLFHLVTIGQCVLPTFNSIYDTKRERWWDFPPAPPESVLRVIGGTELIAFDKHRVYSLKLKPSVQPPTSSIPTCATQVYSAMLFSPDFSDVTFVCSDGTEIPAHRNVLAAKNPYFRAYFSGPWTQQHPDGRWETEKSSDVIKALLSLMYTGTVPRDMNARTLLGLLESAYEFQLDGDLVKLCQAKCIEKLSVSNVKDLLLSARLHGASFLFDACFKFVCEHYAAVASDPDFAEEVIKTDRQLWRDLVESSHNSSRKRQRSNSGDSDSEE